MLSRTERRLRNEWDGIDALLPSYDVEDRRTTVVKAAPARVFASARRFSLFHSRLINAVMYLRRWVLGSKGTERALGGFVNEMKSFGWVVLDEVPGRRIVLGTVTKPWEADPAFAQLTAEQWFRFSDPGYVKMIFCLSVFPLDADASAVRTTMRMTATDNSARRRLRLYWSLFAPGIRLVRAEGLRLIRDHAQRET